VDRKKDTIIRGGFNVYPRDLEEVLLTQLEVSLTAVVGGPHPSHGEEVKAFVVRTRRGSHRGGSYRLVSAEHGGL
jgi:long-chain acyl-CoA synthetase